MMAVYRYGNWVHRSVRIPILSQLLWLIYWIAYIAISIVVFGSQIPAKCTIGKGLKLPHPFGIFLTGEVVIGDNALLWHQVTIGHARELGPDSPVLGDNVIVGTGAKILGKVRIGNNVKIGANAVVVHDVPEGATVVGVPARIHHAPDES
jgi:serine O-acetyltransferase